VSIVIEPFYEREDASLASESHDLPEDSQGTIAPAEPVRRRARHGSSPSAAWIVAAAAVASALTALLAVPVYNRANSATEPTTTPAVVLDRADTLPPTADRLIVHPVLAAACHYLFTVAADALGEDPDSYARAAFSVTGTQGRSLNDVVHDDLAAVRDEILRLPLAVPAGSAARVEALAVALARTDAAPCSSSDRPPPQPRSWSITEAP
jgi:hypothetical protein